MDPVSERDGERGDSMSYDRRCENLAYMFLIDHQRTDLAPQLAQVIQDAIEVWISGIAERQRKYDALLVTRPRPLPSGVSGVLTPYRCNECGVYFRTAIVLEVHQVECKTEDHLH
jgi:predicted Zn-ribbon and HTH transcriptional regulator